MTHGWSQPEAELVLQEATSYLRERKIPFRKVVEMTDPRELLVEIAEREEADLVVAHAERVSGRHWASFGSSPIAPAASQPGP